MRDLAILSMHTSPLAQPGTGDGGGMNVYVRELATALARSGVRCEVFTRADDPSRPPSIHVEPGFRVHHVPAGPAGPVVKEALPDLVDEWAAGVRDHLAVLAGEGRPVEAVHANYWLSGVAGHRLKHELDVPLLSTFHTLDRVKAEASPEELSAAEPARRALAETEIIGCSDVIVASCSVEADQLADHYGAPRDRIEVVAPGIDHAFFAPGQQAQARRAIGLPPDDPLVLFVGRIQPLKGLAVVVEALAVVVAEGGRLAATTLVAVGGPSGPHGEAELARIRDLSTALGLRDRLRLVPPQRHEMLSTYYRSADVCVVPSRSESFGLVVLEAAACGIPVLASAVGGLTTLVDDGRTGVLLDPLDPDAWSSHLVRLLAEPAVAERTGSAGALRAGDYTWSWAAAVLRDRCEQLTARSRGVPVGRADEAELARLRALIEEWAAASLADNELLAAVDRDPDMDRWYVRTPGEEKLVITVWLTLRERTLHFETYFMPAPEEGHGACYEYLLRSNPRLFAWRFAIGGEDAVYLVGQLPLGAVDADELDRIVGSGYAYSEQYFAPAMSIGYASKFRR